MYLMPHCVPIYLDGPHQLLPTDWKRSLLLLRDALGGRFGPLGIVGPTAPAGTADQILEPVGSADGIELLPMHPDNVSLASYWSKHHRLYQRRMAEILPRTRVVHGIVLDDLRPYVYRTMQMAWARKLPTIFVLDQDYDARMARNTQAASLLHKPGSWLRQQLYSAQCRSAARQADLCLFKGKATVARYGPFARNVHRIEDTSYLSGERVAEEIPRNRVADLVSHPRPVKFVFCGRLVSIKGIDVSIRLLHALRAAGHPTTFDVFGGGPEQQNLQNLTSELGMNDCVRFHGARPYGPELLGELARHDALLFTPRVDETPRMIFDGYAAGLPLVASDIDFVKERSEDDRAVHLLPRDDFEGSVRSLKSLLMNLERLPDLTEKALAAARFNSADEWYRRRAEWTFEMMASRAPVRRAAP